MEILEISKGSHSYQVYTGNNRDFWQRVANGTWEQRTFEVFDRFIDRQQAYIDIGSWIGPTVLFGCQLAKVSYAIEPDPIAYAELAANVSINSAVTGKLTLFNGCISNRTGNVRMGNCGQGGDSTTSVLFKEHETNWVVPGLSFEDFIKKYEITECAFIKLDIEGGEYAVLPSMARYLAKHRPTLLLSLHPFFLGDLNDIGFFGKVKRNLLRLAKTFGVLRSLQGYQHFFDPSGRRIGSLHLLWMGMRGIGCEVVVTDREWDTTKRASVDAGVTAIK